MAVNSTAWRRFPVAERGQTFNADDAIDRIKEHSGGNVSTFNSAFLWRNSQGAANNVDSYRLPVADVVNGKLTLIPHAVFAAAAILSGAHGGLEGVVGDEEKKRLKGVITEIYAMFQKSYGDPRVKPPWLRGGNKEEDVTASAGAAPVAPPAEWFSNPMFHAPTPISITADGRVMGHLAAWDVCHTGMGGCVTAPHSPSGYKYFANGEVVTAEGTTAKVGRIVMDTYHARDKIAATAAKDHYAHTGNTVAIVAAGEDRYGIWLSGGLVPEVTPEQVAKLRRSPLSGDWRGINGSYELIAALAVSSPGFPITASASGDEDADMMIGVGIVDIDGTILASTPPLEQELPQIPDIRAAERLAAVEQHLLQMGVEKRRARMRRIMS